MSFFGRRHSKLTGDDVGTVIWKEVVDTAARLALSLSSSDDGKIVKQLDNGSFWVLDDYSGPVWTELSSVGVAAVTSVFGEIGDVTEADASFTAADIANVAAGNIVATDVQAAIDELDAEKTPLTHTHVLSQITDSGTAAAEDVGVTVGDIPQLEDVGGGTPGLPAVDGSQLTGVAGGGSAITVEDDGTPVTTDVTLLNFAGAGVTISEPVVDEITITIAPGAAPIDTVFGRTGAVVATADDYTASEVANVAAGDIVATDVQAAIDELDTEKAATGDSRFPTTDEKGALAGTGTPSGSNLYVTADTLAAKTHTLSDITDSGTAAAEDIGATIGDAVGVVDVGGSVAGLPVLDGSQLTGVTAAAEIDVEDDGTPVINTPHSTINFVGGGVTAEDAGGGTVDVTIAPGAAPVDTVFGRTGTVLPVADDYTADEVTNVPAGGIAATDVQAAINELDTEKAAVGHTQTYTTVDGVPTDTFLGRDAAGTGASEAMTPTVARALLNVEDGSVAAGISGDAYATSHEADATAHTAAEVVNTPAGDIVAITVQAAIDELDTEKSATGHTHTLSGVTDSGTAAAQDVGVTIGDVVQLENVGGNPGMPTVDGSQLTGVTADVTVVDESTTLTANLVKMTFAGAGVAATEPGAEGEILVTVPGVGAGVIDIADGTTTVSGADLLTFDGTAFTVTDQGNDDALVTADFGAGSGQFAEGDHTHDTLANIETARILGRVTGGSGLSEELTFTQTAGLLDHADLGAGIGTNTHAQIDTHIADATIHNTTYIQDSAPGAPVDGNVWIDTVTL